MSIDAEIRSRISKNGYISISEMIDAAMNEFAFSYYKNNQAIGVHSDFITSPEISQLFGEMISLWCIDSWCKMNKPQRCNLIEFGPGNGVLMHMILKTVKKIAPDFYKTIDVHLIEINPVLKEKQSNILANFDVSKQWHSSIQNFKTRNNIVIANEFFDALSINQYVKKKHLWHEVIVKIDVASAKLIFDHISTNIKFSEQLDREHPSAQDGAILEESLPRISVMQELSELLANYNGSALIVDYGYYINPFKRKASQYNSTLQSVKDHQYNPVLHNLGKADLTSHVDFWELKRVAQNRNLQIDTIITQREFLLKWGMRERLKMLIKQNPQHEQILINQYNRLVGLNQMGNLFKVLCISNIENIF